jgi:hypothetical protein
VLLTLDLSAAVYEQLAILARGTGRSPEEIACRALLDVLEDHEDAKIAEERIRTDDGTRISWDEIRAKYPDEAGLLK